MSNINHPYILKMNGVAQDNRILYIYLEYIKNGDLMNLVNKFREL
jgi:serine/threonine protein kinase